MKEYKVFLASSMRNSCREQVCDIIDDVNKRLKISDIQFDLIAYSEAPMEDLDGDTQRMLNHKAAQSDVLVILLENNTPVGAQTFSEYLTAHVQSLKNANKRPFIKVFALYGQEGETMSLLYSAHDGEVRDFESELYGDSKRYVQCLLRNRFKDFFAEWLLKVALFGLDQNIRQSELSYGDHLFRIGQGGIRQNNEKYFRREQLDGQIENVLRTSPIVILEGSTYSGKTRAAFEYMKHCAEWEDYDFHIYDNRHSVKDLNEIRRMDYTGFDRGNVFLFDDVNDILNKKDESLNRTDGMSLWTKLNGYNQLNGFTLEDFGKTRIIFTVSGKLSIGQRKDVYRQLFNSASTELYSALESVIINFDIYNPLSFKTMVNEMVRDGLIARARITPGNYTIGSLYIRTEEIRAIIETQYLSHNALLLALVAHFKYTLKSRFQGMTSEIEELYDFICRDYPRYCKSPSFYDGIETLRQEGLLVPDGKDERPDRIFIDKYILDILNELVIGKVGKERNTDGAFVINGILIRYAMKCHGRKRIEGEVHHIWSVAQMGYLLIDRNRLSDMEIVNLINIVSSELLGEKYRPGGKITSVIMNLVDVASLPDRYHAVFASTAIANIKNGADDYLRACYEYCKFCKRKSKPEIAQAIALYKQSVFSMLAADNRQMTMAEEQQVLDRILDSDENWKYPFEEDDLKDVFNLSRLGCRLKKKSVLQIIDMLPYATLDAGDMTAAKYDETDSGTEFDFDDFDSPSASAMYSQQDDDGGVYEKIFLKKLSDTIFAALSRVRSYDDFISIANHLVEVSGSSEQVKSAIALKGYFSRGFYHFVPEIARRINFPDRAVFFEYVFSIEDGKGPFGNVVIPLEYAGTLRAFRIMALNKMLGDLDEKDALEGYRKMVETGLSDSHTMSLLLNNESLNFEQALHLVGKEEGRNYYLILNQLMRKAETISDANVCMRMMGIHDCNPAKLRDENALANYFQIKYVDAARAVRIIRERHRLIPGNLSDPLLNIVLRKFSFDKLTDIFFPSENNAADGYYMEHYGLLDDEVCNIRRNAILLNILFCKANERYEDEEVARLVEGKFNSMCRDEEARELITDPESNGNNCILSAYMRNKRLFDGYESLMAFYDNLPMECRPQKVDNNIYNVFLWNIVHGYDNKKYDRETAINLLNRGLLNAYSDFANSFAEKEVVNMMAKLYHYRPLLTDESHFHDAEEYVYADKILKVNYPEYLDIIINGNQAYVDGTFIFNSLTMMRETIDEDVYERLAQLAMLNHTGVKYDIIYSKSTRSSLPPVVRQRLLTFGKTINIDTRMVYNVSYIKLLCFALHNRLMTFEEVEDYRRRNDIPVTETYINTVLKNMESEVLIETARYGYDNRIFADWYRQAVDYLGDVLSQETSYIHRSVQMCLSLILIAPDEGALAEIFSKHGFSELEDKTEVTAARMKRILQLRFKRPAACQTLALFKDNIINNCCNVNIWIINTYLSAFLKIAKGDLLVEDGCSVDSAPMERCWPLLKEDGVIDVFELLDLYGSDRKDVIVEQLGLGGDRWLIEANVQTFSYFARCSADLISLMDARFKGDFAYDDAKKKNCLKETLKYYALYYHGYREENNGCLHEEIKHIRDILSRKENIKVYYELRKQYLKFRSRKLQDKWAKINLLWKDIFDEPNTGCQA